ncbi:MAG: NAD(P)-dependent oxidoreductase [Candidatus Rickettsiella isopodorum]|jgi:dTDP-glucose 4,6-dehydratase|nr:NAD(P)-dependent oxidoreductase [Gammaproteobacteria bacterium]MDQ5899322.1 dTDP-glucose 4,6-dehydratase [Pseudomonadota bacterium]
MPDNLLSKDLNDILSQTLTIWNELKDQRIFITGGTGFLGTWILESFVWINKKLKLNAEAVILTRDAESFLKKCPHLINDKALQFYEGNILDFKYPKGKFSYVIHAATDSNYTRVSSWEMLETIIEGTKHTLEFAKNSSVKKFLFISSGAIYGKQSGVDVINESHLSRLEATGLMPSYAIGKFIAEYMSNLYAREYQFDLKIARCFAFFGPYVPLNLHFAIGNFIHNRLKNETILIKGDGHSFRSYLYIADVCIWLWTILFQGKNLTAYNVGSHEKYSIEEMAHRIANCMEPKVMIKIVNNNIKSSIAEDNYIPDITLIKQHLNLAPRINFVNALNLTMEWFRKKYQLNEFLI